ncbi:MAG: helix-turn-helix transcriptional regulator [Deltaproteobacteria bacterium]|nr:helix-turn-helix transcriptional regulator [Deltaproteobacteria bacterium]
MLARAVAARARALRLEKNLSQAGLARAAGVSLASLRRFERTGAIAFVSLVRLAIVLDATEPLSTWFTPSRLPTIDEALAESRPRQRGRRR